MPLPPNPPSRCSPRSAPAVPRLVRSGIWTFIKSVSSMPQESSRATSEAQWRKVSVVWESEKTGEADWLTCSCCWCGWLVGWVGLHFVLIWRKNWHDVSNMRWYLNPLASCCLRLLAPLKRHCLKPWSFIDVKIGKFPVNNFSEGRFSLQKPTDSCQGCQPFSRICLEHPWQQPLRKASNGQTKRWRIPTPKEGP